MRLSRRARALYALLSLSQAYVLASMVGRADWVGAVLAGVMLLLFGVPAIRGRDPLAAADGAPRWGRASEGGPDSPREGERM